MRRRKRRKIDPNQSPQKHRLRVKKQRARGFWPSRRAFRDLMDETPVARLGAEARLSNQSTVAAGQARASRSLVAMSSTAGSSGGISNAGVSRNVGSGNVSRLGDGGVGFTRVESASCGLAEERRGRSVLDLLRPNRRRNPDRLRSVQGDALSDLQRGIAQGSDTARQDIDCASPSNRAARCPRVRCSLPIWLRRSW